MIRRIIKVLIGLCIAPIFFVIAIFISALDSDTKRRQNGYKEVSHMSWELLKGDWTNLPE